MTKRLSRKLFTLVLLLSTVLVSGVYATWSYARGEITPSNEHFDGITLNVFEFPPDEILPGGDTQTAQPGQNHYGLMELVLNESKKGYGLNASTSNVLNSYLKNYGEVYSNQKASGGNLKFIIDTKNNTYGLYYALEKVSDTLIYCYTFKVDELIAASGTENEIEVYRTTLEKTNKWNMTVSYCGHAQTVKLSALGFSADPQSHDYTILFSSWHVHASQTNKT